MMNKSKLAVIAASAVLAGSLLGGMAYAATAENAPAASNAATAPATTPAERAAQHEADEAARLAQAVTDGKITQAEADVLTQLDALRDAAMAKLDADSKALIGQAVTEGKITQEQADKLQSHKGPGGPGGFGEFGGKGGGRGHGGPERGFGRGGRPGQAPADGTGTAPAAPAQNG